MKKFQKLTSQLSAFVMLSAFSASAWSQQDFPKALQSRFDSSEFVIVEDGLLGLGIDDISPYVGSFFVYLDQNQVERVLIRFAIGGDSHSEDLGISTPLTGVAYLDCQRNPALNQGAFEFVLYLEKLDQDVVGSGIYFQFATIDLRYVGVQNLLNGSGSYSTESGVDGLISETYPLSCLAKGCNAGATFQLSRFGYVDLGNGMAQLNIDPVAAGMTQFPRLYEHFSSFPGDAKCPGFYFFQRFELSPILLGDANRDGAISLLDVAPFVDVLTSGRFQFESDANKDHHVDLLDVSAMVAILVGP